MEKIKNKNLKIGFGFFRWRRKHGQLHQKQLALRHNHSAPEILKNLSYLPTCTVWGFDFLSRFSPETAVKLLAIFLGTLHVCEVMYVQLLYIYMYDHRTCMYTV